MGGWPVVAKSWNGEAVNMRKVTDLFFEPSADVQKHADMKLLLILDETQWASMPCTFVSPLAQKVMRKHVQFGRRFDLKIRIEPTEPLAQLLTVAAKKGFVNISRLILNRLATHRSLGLRSGVSMFELLWALVKDATALSDEQCLEVLKRRSNSTRMANVDDLLPIGDAVAILDRGDQKD